MANLGVHTLRRAGLPNWPVDVNEVVSTLGGRVFDLEGRSYDTRLVLPVPLDSSPVQEAFGGGSKIRVEKRKEATAEYRHDLIRLLGSRDLHLGDGCEGARQNQTSIETLDCLRLTSRCFVDLFPDFEIVGSGPAQWVKVRS